MIVVNARFLTQKITGVQRYALEISKRLPKAINQHNVVFVAPKNKVFQNTLPSHFEVIRFGNFEGNTWEQIDLPRFLYKQQNPLLINFGGIGPLYYKNKITFIHDLAFKHFPMYYSFIFQKSYNVLLPKSAQNSKKIITVSQYVKNDLENTYGFTDISVIHPSISSKFKDNNNKREKIILALSSLSPRKNIKRVIKAYLQLNTDYKLVFIGSASNSFSSFDIAEFKDHKNIVFTGYLSDEEIINYYNRATVFVYASTFEGFGIPPLEAQACGCTCLVSNTTSLPEVYQDSVLYCDPFSVDDIKNQLEKLLDNHNLRAHYRKKGQENYQRFSWETSANQLVQLIAELNH